MSLHTTPQTPTLRDNAVELPLLARLLRAARNLETSLDETLSTLGLTHEQWRVLAVLASGGGHIMSELAQLAVVPPATATRIVDHLVTNGLVYRRADPSDRRRVVVHLSARGARTIEPALAAEARAERAVADALGPRGYVGFVSALDTVSAPAGGR
ncbi:MULTISPECIES: MarR family winged helix-turn-helix transcriptional regulator [Gordonia]|uniref:MarR family winged helix-turn-helix transcriptional regulator n=1 Tax=Gordonia TaxID=2053 RepID=UPI00257ECD4F|nr:MULTISPECIES: MarR family transcriptional regulator [Gordonia]